MISSDIQESQEDIQQWMYQPIDVVNDECEAEADTDKKYLEIYYNKDATNKYKDNEDEVEKNTLSKLQEKEALLDKEKIDLAEKTSLVEEISKNLQNLLLEFDDNLLDLLTNLVKRTVESIVIKEINVDRNVLLNMIHALQNSLAHENELTTVFLSEHDANLLHSLELDEAIKLVVDPSLSSGDIRLKNKYSEISALLKQRINQLME